MSGDVTEISGAANVAPVDTSSDSIDLDSALAEYDNVAPEHRPQTDGEKLPASLYTDVVRQHDANTAAAKEAEKFGEMTKTVTDIEHRFLAREAKLAEAIRADQDRTDFGKVVKYATETIDELKMLPDDYAVNYLRNEAMTNAALAQAWKERHDSPEAQARFNSQVDRALKSLAHGVSRLPDRDVTEDVRAVSEFMRRGRGTPAEARTPSYHAMTENEFAAEKAKFMER